MSDAQPHTVKITYAPGILRVFLDDLNEPVMVVPLDLAATLQLTGGLAWVGFTATAGGGANFEAHDVLDWRFQHSVTPPADADGDGLPDWWELRYFGGATNGVPGADVDADGASVFRISSFTVGSQVTVQAWTSARVLYQLERRDTQSLASQWEAQGGWTTGADDWLQLISTNLNQPAFFRLRVAVP